MSVSGLSITPCSFTSSTVSPASTEQPIATQPSASEPLSVTQPHGAMFEGDSNTHLHTQHCVQGWGIVPDQWPIDSHVSLAERDDNQAELSVVTQQLNEFMHEMNRTLSFYLDEDLNRQVVSVIDRESGEVIRQLPSEEMLAIAKNMADQMAGILLNTEL
ncbi:flagellar protein FlaG [Plesiomonas sp.]|uniref:flagellar protein FlaG n=1 Tax=Plesiomonas sp. TaxID=2486279 RepID=UPI003F2AB4A6